MSIKITDVTPRRVKYSKIFLNSNSNDVKYIDIAMDISYSIDEDSIDFEDYDITYETLDRYDLEDIIPCYMIVTLNNEEYKNIDKVDYEELEYVIVSDYCSDVADAEVELYDVDKLKAIKLIERYLETDKFKDELKKTLMNNKQII